MARGKTKFQLSGWLQLFIEFVAFTIAFTYGRDVAHALGCTDPLLVVVVAFAVYFVAILALGFIVATYFVGGGE